MTHEVSALREEGVPAAYESNWLTLVGDGQEAIADAHIPIEVTCEEASEACLAAAKP